jgi:hypothetical protein
MFQAELVLQGPDDRLDPLAQPVGKGAGLGLVAAGRADQSKLKVGEERLGVRTSQALVGHHGAAGCWTVGRLGIQQLLDGLAFAHQLGVGQTEPGDRPLWRTDHQQQLDTPVVAAVEGS